MKKDFGENILSEYEELDEEDIAKGRKPFKKANRPFVPLKQEDFLFNGKDTCCEEPIVDRVKMMRVLLDKLELCPPENKEKYNKILAQYIEVLKDFMYVNNVFPVTDCETDDVMEDYNERKKQFSEDMYNVCYSNITWLEEPYLDRNKFERPEEYDAFIQQWEAEWREALKHDLAESWLWKTDKSAIFEPNIACMGKLESDRVRVPHWMYATETFEEQEFHMTTIEKIALAHALHFTLSHAQYGYLECSGHVEMWCRCSVRDAHNAFLTLQKRNLVDIIYVRPGDCHSFARNWGWIANVPKIHNTLQNYGRWLET